MPTLSERYTTLAQRESLLQQAQEIEFNKLAAQKRVEADKCTKREAAVREANCTAKLKSQCNVNSEKSDINHDSCEQDDLNSIDFQNVRTTGENLIPKTQEARVAERKIRIERKKKMVAKLPIGTAIGTKQAGNIAFEKGDFEMAVIWYTDGIKKLSEGSTLPHAKGSNPITDTPILESEFDPDLMAALLCNRSASYTNMGDYIDAVNDAKKSIKLRPTFVKGYARKGSALWHMGRIEEARRAYSDGLQYNSNSDALKQGIQQCDILLKTELSNNYESNGVKIPQQHRTLIQYLKMIVNPMRLQKWRDIFLYYIITFCGIVFFTFKLQGFEFSNPIKGTGLPGDPIVEAKLQQDLDAMDL